MKQLGSQYFASVIQTGLPDAAAVMTGSPKYPRLQGTVSFYQTPFGVLVTAAVRHLPISFGKCVHPVFALHIHEGANCMGTPAFQDAGGHFNPNGCEHPAHAGDLPPLFADRTGFAWMGVLTDRFRVEDVMGRTVIIHSGVDDFTSQPAGNAGERIACGMITPTKRM